MKKLNVKLNDESLSLINVVECYSIAGDQREILKDVSQVEFETQTQNKIKRIKYIHYDSYKTILFFKNIDHCILRKNKEKTLFEKIINIIRRK